MVNIPLQSMSMELRVCKDEADIWKTIATSTVLGAFNRDVVVGGRAFVASSPPLIVRGDEDVVRMPLFEFVRMVNVGERVVVRKCARFDPILFRPCEMAVVEGTTRCMRCHCLDDNWVSSTRLRVESDGDFVDALLRDEYDTRQDEGECCCECFGGRCGTHSGHEGLSSLSTTFAGIGHIDDVATQRQGWGRCDKNAHLVVDGHRVAPYRFKQNVVTGCTGPRHNERSVLGDSGSS